MSSDDNKTYFERAKRSFKDVPMKDGEIPTTEYLEAAESVVGIFDLLNSVAFSPVQSDMTGNIKKVRDRQLLHPTQSETLQALVNNELAGGTHVATEGLLWLNRGLSFTAKALRKSAQNPNDSLSTSFTNGYNESLKKHHNFLVKGVFAVAMRACPTREDFYLKLGPKDQEQDKVDMDNIKSKLEEWLTSLELCVNIMDKWIEKVKW